MTKYICPMHPEVKQDAPGFCPKCGMSLVEVTPRSPERSRMGEVGERMDHHDHHAMMAQDFKKRFFVVLPLMILVLAFSPKIQQWLGFLLTLPYHNVSLFLLGSAIVLYGAGRFTKRQKTNWPAGIME